MRTVLIAMTAVSLAACASSTSDISNALNQTLTEPDSTLAFQESEDLTIVPQDRLSIAVLELPDIPEEYVVDQYGMIKMPYIGEIEAVGHTQNDLAKALEDAYEKTLLQSADITVSITESQARQLRVGGAVESPGTYTIEGKMHLREAVIEAGGPDDTANPKRVMIMREIEGQRMAALYDLTAISRGEADDPLVYGNDIIIVDGSTVREQYGSVLRTLTTLALFLAI